MNGRAELLRERRVAPSILSADFARLGDQVAAVMDGHFVPPITIGPLVVSSLREQVHAAGGFLDVHLMIERPERHVAEFAQAGADMITIHQEATPHVHYALKAVREAGCFAGLAINPGTAVEVVIDVRDIIDNLLCMTVNPGWGGQPFIPASIGRVARLRKLVRPDLPIEVDGGVDARTAGPCAEAGATLFVAGSAVFGAADPGTAYSEIAAAAGAA